ncbi:MAG TPA: histidine phosphatase family protein [Stellaceae bacterium]
MTILLVRHGETEWNLEGRYQGRLDSPLTARGTAQAQAIGRLLARLQGTAAMPIFTSPLGRARHTADIIAGCIGNYSRPRPDDRLREISLGSWDGLTRKEIALRAPELFTGAVRCEWYFRSPDGETYEGFAARVGAWLDEWRDDDVVVVAHGVVSRVLRGLYGGLDRRVALTLPVPQDAIFRLSAGAIEKIGTDADRSSL